MIWGHDALVTEKVKISTFRELTDLHVSLGGPSEFVELFDTLLYDFPNSNMVLYSQFMCVIQEGHMEIQKSRQKSCH